MHIISRSWKSRVGVVALTATMGIGLVGLASPAGAADANAAAKASCKNGGWKTLVRADRTPFRNQGDCVSYAAQGGTPVSAKSASQLRCEALGGSFVVGTGVTLWDCNGTTGVYNDDFAALDVPCLADLAVSGGQFFGTVFGPPNSYECATF